MLLIFTLLAVFLLPKEARQLGITFSERACLMPRMIHMGRRTWVANGILFALYHGFQLWMRPVLLTAILSFAFIAFHSRSILPSAAIHFITNFLFSILGILYLMLQSV
jgi:membrane protease YdiL (CAAX protease family)